MQIFHSYLPIYTKAISNNFLNVYVRQSRIILFLQLFPDFSFGIYNDDFVMVEKLLNLI